MTLYQATSALQSQLVQLYDEREAANIAALVIEHVTGWKRIDRVLNKHSSLPAEQLALLEKDTAQLLQHRPVQYVLGEAWFWGMKFFVNEQVLIPRPETEELVDWILHDLKQAGRKSKPKILDVGTGSGCLAIALKKEWPGAQMIACDVSREALLVAGKNAAANAVQVDFLQTDFLQPEQRNRLPVVDVLVSNPPYIPIDDKKDMQPHVLQYEPHLALFVENNDPLIFYKAMAGFAKKHLLQGGALYAEIHEHMGQAVSELFQAEGFRKVEVRKDLQGRERMVRALPSTEAGFNGP
ncbi:MAG: peptide chain release factor N(5)-glutamine methyltransferase [Williamsia sp.]|nr:peptide chain release factor N(5)-glutamine methyltransferase [Williamsia sp.]